MTLLDAATLRSAYRRMLAVPATRRWACGAMLPAVCVGGAFACGGDANVAIRFVLLPMLGVVTLTDLAWRRIPNWILVPGLLWSIGIAAAGGMLAGTLAGAALCFGAMLGLHLLFGGGEGDVKLFAVIGAALGASAGLDVLLSGYLLAAAFAVILILARIARRADEPWLAGHLPMAPFFSLAVFLTTLGH